MLALIAWGIISTAAAVGPGTGDVDVPASQMASAKVNASGGGAGTGIPSLASIWTQPLDPSDRNKYGMDWAPVLGDETIATIESITMSALGASLGVQVDSDADRIPIIDTQGQKVQLWFKVDPSFKNNAAFSDPGTRVAVSVLIKTDSTPYRELERTWVLTVLQQ